MRLPAAPLQPLALLLGALALLAQGCQPDYVPKQRGYARVVLPPPAYTPLPLDRPYSFDVSTHAQARPASAREAKPEWMDIYYPAFDATVDLTFIDPKNDLKILNEYIEVARKLTSRHQVKASGIDERLVRSGTGNQAHIFRLTGQVPTQYQFFVTDSSRHFLRGALYFKTATANDSLAPMIDYISKDMDHLIETLKWR